MFDDASRYSKQETYTILDHRGREVTVVVPPDAPILSLLGIHRRVQGQRLDHLAHKYLRNPTLFWRICELNNVMLAEALSEADEIEIPAK
jgi:hypothetical protein